MSQPTEEAPGARVRASFERQEFMKTLGATLERVSPGEVVIRLSPHPRLTQQHGFVHAGVVTSIADSACGYAALSMMPVGHEVMSVEFKVNLLAPATGSAIEAHGRVVRSGRTLSVCQADVFASSGDGGLTRVATMLATMIGRAER